MLARLEGIPGLDEAKVDHRGELLKLVVARADVLDAVRRELSALGYRAEPLSGLRPIDVRWHAFDDVRDLSREEAEIIARRITPRFARSHGLGDADTVRLEQAAVEALYRCFAATDLAAGAPSGTLRAAWCTAVEHEVRSVIRDDAAREYAALLAKDLARPGAETNRPRT